MKMIIGLLVLTVLTAIISAIISTKIIAACYFKIIVDFLKNYDKQIMDLISWAKEKDKHQ